MNCRRIHPAIVLLSLAGLFWAAFLSLLAALMGWFGASFSMVVLTGLISAWGVWTVVITRSRRVPVLVSANGRGTMENGTSAVQAGWAAGGVTVQTNR